METTRPTTRIVQRLSRNVKRIKFNNHYEIWHSEKTDPKAKLKIPGRHVDENGVIRDNRNYVVVTTGIDITKVGKLINTSLGVGKCYETNPKLSKTVSIFTNW
jgi:hypothetical protein